jgi:hypothetical protein
MIDVVYEWPHQVEFYITDNLPVHEAKGEPSPLKLAYANEDLDAIAAEVDVVSLYEWFNNNWRAGVFYRAMLGKLWWQK